MPAGGRLTAGSMVCLLLAVTAATAATPAVSAVDAGFLEFLALLVEDDGEYLDPLDLANVYVPDEDAAHIEAAADTVHSGEAAAPGGVAVENEHE